MTGRQRGRLGAIERWSCTTFSCWWSWPAPRCLALERRGLATGFAGLAGGQLSGGAVRWSESIAHYFGEPPTPWNRFVAMLVLYAGSSLVIWSLFRLVSNWINRVQLKDFDHQLGGVLGAAKGVLWCVVITFFAITLSRRGPGQNSALPLGLLHRGAAGSGRRGDAQGAARSDRPLLAQARKGTGPGRQGAAGSQLLAAATWWRRCAASRPSRVVAVIAGRPGRTAAAGKGGRGRNQDPLAVPQAGNVGRSPPAK